MMIKVVLSAKQFGNLVKINRKKYHLTQKELAAVCGCGVRFIQDLEKGKQSCELGLSLSVLAMLGIRLEAITPVIPEAVLHVIK
ncbi:helix-turn-helix domain-containing protein [Candidatus Berkiella aquae]|uniref:Helix-turn-helix domain-containing protein n=2 Tax=Candidatus Berkiella aquae TaxID=295108 RepID=A0AAE3HV49_9GAMM|nr:helix-turn-helix domain-containing protein [Candidatus Berkiella aquae]MCS5710753.1 helix-turn-helix domain-containing protein [Candidatus Berkiella aquae]